MAKLKQAFGGTAYQLGRAYKGSFEQPMSRREAALILGISEGTVKKHLEHIFEKLGVEKRGAASLIALEALVA